MGGSASSDGDRLSHGSADSSSEANGEDHTLFTRSLIIGDAADNHCSGGRLQAGDTGPSPYMYSFP